ncbi:MAG: hypothetical protein WB791_09455 [Waddliaceae bacterium]
MAEYEHKVDELEEYGDPRIVSGNAAIAWWLKLTYILLPIWGIVWFYLTWNGAVGWLDPGYWDQLEKAANTTFPHQNFNNPPPSQRSQDPDLKQRP